MSGTKIPWWYTNIPSDDFSLIQEVIDKRSLSLGNYVHKFQEEFSFIEKAKYGVATTSGTTALILAGLAAGIREGDEVIIPNRTWIATANAFKLIGAEIVICPVKTDKMCLDDEELNGLITRKTKAIIPVSLNGRNVITSKLISVVKKYNLWLIEDASQGFGAPRPYRLISENRIKYCRTYSFSMAKFITTGQGGMIITSDQDFAKELSLRRTHGVKNVETVNQWNVLGSNFRMSDLQASIGLSQLKRINEKKEKYIEVYNFYKSNLNALGIKQIPVDPKKEIPIYAEFIAENRENLVKSLNQNCIETRIFYPDINSANYLNINNREYKETIFSKSGIYLPSGDGLKISELKKICSKVNSFYKNFYV